jgi:hypothetical protein
MRPVSRVVLLCALAIAAWSLTIEAQLPGTLRLPAVRLPSLADLTRGEPPLNTNVNNIPVRGWPEFDRLELDGFVPLTNADRGTDGRFLLKPGRYELQLRSFCARGYTYGPTRGDGYVRGAWQGSKADLLREILQRYTVMSDSVDQRDAQLLVWAVLSRMNPEEMRGGARRALVQLLGDRGVELMARGALDYYAAAAARKLFGQANRQLRPLLEYDNRMRGMFRDANRRYEDYERLTMRPQPRDTRTEIPGERWNLHPAGYLVRVASTGYSRMTMQVVVPGRPVIARDQWRRVTRFAIDDYALTITYRDQGPGTPYPGDRGLTAHVVTGVRIDVPAGRGGALERDVDAWIFTGRPTARRRASGRVGIEAPAAGVRLMNASWSMRPYGFLAAAPAVRASAVRPSVVAAQFGDWERRAEQASEIRDRIETYEEWYARQERIKRGERPDEDVFDSNHIRDLIDSIFGGSDDRLEQIGETHGRLAEWLAHATREIDSLGDGTPVDPTDSPYAPGRAGGQTLIGSGATW